MVSEMQAINDVVYVYGKNTSHCCLNTKSYLQNKNVDFVFYDIDVDILKKIEMLEKLSKADIPSSTVGLPVIDAQGKIFTTSEDFNDFLKKLTDE